MIVQIKKLNENAILPTRGSEEAAGYDLHACVEDKVWLRAGETKLIDVGFSIALPKDTFGAIFARSGLAVKEGLRPANCVGVIDSDYRGPVKVAVHNDSDTIRCIEDGERIAQMVLLPYIPMGFCEVDELNETSRGEGGFGSTGV